MPYMTKSTGTSIFGASILSGQVISRRVFSGQVFSGVALGDDNSRSKWVIIGWKGGGASRTRPYFNAHFDPNSRPRSSKIAKHHHYHFKSRLAFFCMQFSHVKMGSNAVWHFVWLWSNGKIAKHRHYHFKGRSAPLVWKLRKLTTVSVTDVVNSPRGRFPRIGTFAFNTFLLCVSRHICV